MKKENFKKQDKEDQTTLEILVVKMGLNLSLKKQNKTNKILKIQCI